MRVTMDKNCWCHTCGRALHYLGISNHRLGHRNRREDCTITSTYGDTHTYEYSKWDERGWQPTGQPTRSNRA